MKRTYIGNFFFMYNSIVVILYLGMSSHNLYLFGECPKPKKSKTSQDITAYWAHLPSVLLHEIFCLLNKEDKKNVSLVCKHWRENSFHPK